MTQTRCLTQGVTSCRCLWPTSSQWDICHTRMARLISLWPRPTFRQTRHPRGEYLRRARCCTSKGAEAGTAGSSFGHRVLKEASRHFQQKASPSLEDPTFNPAFPKVACTCHSCAGVFLKGLLNYKHVGILERLLRDVTSLHTVRTFQGGILGADVTSERLWGRTLTTYTTLVFCMSSSRKHYAKPGPCQQRAAGGGSPRGNGKNPSDPGP